MKLRANGSAVFGKFWQLPDPEPADEIGSIPSDPGLRGVGFYVYPYPDLALWASMRLEAMEITIP
jgi:hypothetical protein